MPENKKMTKKQLIEALKALHGSEVDQEQGHIEADRLLLEYINDPEVKAAFMDVKRWYA